MFGKGVVVAALVAFVLVFIAVGVFAEGFSCTPYDSGELCIDDPAAPLEASASPEQYWTGSPGDPDTDVGICGPQGIYWVSGGFGPLTIKIKSLPAAGDYKLKFLVVSGTPSQLSESYDFTCGSHTYHIPDDPSLTEDTFYWTDEFLCDFTSGDNTVTLQGTGGHKTPAPVDYQSVSFEKMQITSCIGGGPGDGDDDNESETVAYPISTTDLPFFTTTSFIISAVVIVGIYLLFGKRLVRRK